MIFYAFSHVDLVIFEHELRKSSRQSLEILEEGPLLGYEAQTPCRAALAAEHQT